MRSVTAAFWMLSPWWTSAQWCLSIVHQDVGGGEVNLMKRAESHKSKLKVEPKLSLPFWEGARTVKQPRRTALRLCLDRQGALHVR